MEDGVRRGRKGEASYTASTKIPSYLRAGHTGELRSWVWWVQRESGGEMKRWAGPRAEGAVLGDGQG